MSLSKKSRYVPPHLRDNNKNVIIANPDDEMPPPQKPQRSQRSHHSSNISQSKYHQNVPAPMNQMQSNTNFHPNGPPPPNLIHPQHANTAYPSQSNSNNNPNINNNRSSRGTSNINSPSRRSYQNRTDSPKTSRIINEDWRKAGPTEQPQLNPDDLLPPTQHNIDNNNNNNMNNNNAMNTAQNEQNIPENSNASNQAHPNYQNQGRRYDSRRNTNRGGGGRRGYNNNYNRRGRGRGRGRARRGGGYGGYNNNNNEPSPHQQQQQPQHVMYDDDIDHDDPNEIQFAKIENEEFNNNKNNDNMNDAINEDNPYRKSPFFNPNDRENANISHPNIDYNDDNDMNQDDDNDNNRNWAEMDEYGLQSDYQQKKQQQQQQQPPQQNQPKQQKQQKQQYRVKYVKKQDISKENNDNNNNENNDNEYSPALNARKHGGSRYDRQYTASQTIQQQQQQQHQPQQQQYDELNDNDQQYELSKNFQTLTTEHSSHSHHRQRRRRNNNKPGNNMNINNNKGNIMNDSINNNNINKPQNQRGNITNNNNNKSPKNNKAPINNTNAVQLSLPTKNKRAPSNWAAKLKKPLKTEKASKTDYIASGFVPHGDIKKEVINLDELDSSKPSCFEAEKVCHVLEVLNMTHTDYQSVSMLFRHFQIEFNSLISVKKRWFVVFDNASTAINALNIVKDNQFKLRRIDTNPHDVQMLKNNVPPPIKKKYN